MNIDRRELAARFLHGLVGRGTPPDTAGPLAFDYADAYLAAAKEDEVPINPASLHAFPYAPTRVEELIARGVLSPSPFC